MTETAQAFIAEANACLKTGDRNGAALAWCRALDIDPHLASALNNLGAVLLMSGQPTLALPCFLTATELRPQQADFRIGLARTLVELGEPARAASFLETARRALPDHPAIAAAARQYPADAAVLARFDGLADRAGHIEAADRLAALSGDHDPSGATSDIDTLQGLIWVLPTRPSLWLALSDQARQGGQPLLAELAARRAIALDPRSMAGWRALARSLALAETRQADVVRVLQQAITMCGPRPALVEDVCRHWLANDQAEAARDLLDDMVPDAPDRLADWLPVRSQVLCALGDRAAAARLFVDALERGAPPVPVLIAAAVHHEADLEPGAWLALHDKAARRGADLDHPDLHHARARALFRAGQGEAAQTAITAALGGVLTDEARRSASFMAGQIADQQGQYAVAWQCFEAGNRLLEAGWEARGRRDHTRPLERLASLRRRLEDEITRGQPHAVTPAAPSDLSQGADLAFLVGFPRSGTTLLDSVLRAHSAIVVVEEKPVLIEALREVVPGPVGDETLFTEDWLDAVEAADVEILRAAYRARLAHHAGAVPPGSVVVDKLPLNMNWAAVLHRIFPAAGFILAKRHPLDVAVSNFAQDYAPNNAMLVMTRLERIATFHAASFDFWDRFADWRQPRWAEVVYEQLIEDPEAAIAPVMEMLGRDWEEGQARFFETARARGRISTPSAHQVTKPLYTRSRARWRHYADQLAGPACEPLRQRAQVWGFATETGRGE